ncbi:MAG: ChaN family lipoprotein [Planctomycetes bacterium]|nr:ChaN family lipoprotein [Planctomycetota bacterium]
MKSLPVVAALLALATNLRAEDAIDRRIDEIFNGRAATLTGQLQDLVLHEIGHARRLRDADQVGTLKAARAAARAAAPETVMRKSGATADAEALWDDLRAATVVHFAETHDHVRCHDLEFEAVRQLAGEKGDFAVGLEMFPRSLQPVLDKWTAGELSEWDFLEGVNWYRSWGFPYKLFRPIFLYCRDHHIPLVGLNAPADVNRKVGRTGLRSLSDEERAQLPAEIVLTNEAHRRNFEEILPHHPGIKLDTFYEAFCVWDEMMADSGAQWLKAHGGRLLVIAGSGHIRGGLGIPDRLKRRFRGKYRILLQRDVAEADDNFDLMLAPGADWIWWTKEDHVSAPPKLGVAMDDKLAVTLVAPGSAAEKAGVKVGDVMKRVGKREFTQPESIRHYLELRKHEEFTLVVERGGKETRLKVTVPLDSGK